MKFKYNDYVRCEALTDEVISWVLDKMYEQANSEGGYEKDESESFLDFEREGHYKTLVYAQPLKADEIPTIFFSGCPGLWDRDITFNVLQAYLKENNYEN
jgi:hypothetical protein